MAGGNTDTAFMIYRLMILPVFASLMTSEEVKEMSDTLWAIRKGACKCQKSIDKISLWI